MTSNMSSGKLLLCVIVLTVLSVSGAFFSGSRELALIIGTVILCILFIARGIWGRANSGRLKLAVLTLGLAAVNVAPTGRLLLVQIFTWLLGSPQNSQNAFTNLVPFFEQILSPPDVFERIYSLVVPLYNLGFTALVLKYWHGPSESNDTTLRASDEAPPAPLTYPARRELLLEELQAKYEGMIRNSDWRRARITQWTLDRYLPLAVKVEEKEDGLIWKRPVQSNILRTLHRDRTTRSFLLLGEPGSGKSFTLRKLALDMLKDARSGGQIPIYVDLRDWLPKTAAAEVRIWTESDPPTFEELGTFIEDYLTSHSDPVVVAFVAECFRVMRTRGDFFFIFDSFDELPQLLGEGDDSWLISHLSDLIWRYMTLAPGSRGILASRLFRRPSDDFRATKVLEILPLSEHQVLEALERVPHFDEDLRRSLFTVRRDLLPIARNPFLLALLAGWIDSRGSLPSNQGDLYLHYLEERLHRQASKLRKNNVSNEDVLVFAADVAWFLTTSNIFGLEAPLEEIERGIDRTATLPMMEILADASVARIGSREASHFGFTHRKFLEYLAVRKLLSNPSLLQQTSLRYDSALRDTLVLYTQLAPTRSARAVFRQCLDDLEGFVTTTPNRQMTVQCLRFLVEAFAPRREPVDGLIRDSLGAFLEWRVADRYGDVLLAKRALDATVLLPAERATATLKRGLLSGNEWLRETAFDACAYNGSIDGKLEAAIVHFILTMRVGRFLHRWRLIELSLSVGSNRCQQAVKIRWLELILITCTILVSGYSLMPPWNIRSEPVSVFAALLIALCSVVSLFQIKKFSDFPVEREVIRARFSLLALLYGLVVLLISAHLSVIKAGHFHTCATALTLSGSVFALRTHYNTFFRLSHGAPAACPGLEDLRMIVLTKLIAYAGAILILSMGWGDSLKPHHIDLVFCVVSGILFLLLTPALLDEASKHRREQKLLDRMLQRNRFSRDEVAGILETLSQPDLRLKFAQHLTDRKVSLTGVWPETFSFAPATDPALTELARFEEKRLVVN